MGVDVMEETAKESILEKIRKKLKCGNCGTIFHGTIAQAKHFRYEGNSPYCSALCRKASQLKNLQATNIKAGRKPRKGVLVGPCPACGN